MKTYLRFFILVLGLSPLFVSAQSDMEDVIYLKNGTVYRGTMLDQQYGVSYKIQIQGGSVIVVASSDIEKVTKEKRAWSHADSLNEQSAYPHGVEMGQYQKKDHDFQEIDLTRPPRKEGTGYFFEFQFHLGAVGGGLRMINGYKINQYAILGLGMGFGGIYMPVNGHTINNDVAPYAGFYFPFFLYYSGDILKKDVTPFYVLEAGYAMAYDPKPGGADGATYVLYNTVNGGFMGGAGFGVRIYSEPTHRHPCGFVFTLAADLNIQYARTDVYFDGYMGNSGPPTTSDVYSHMFMLMPGLKIGIGFIN